MTMGKKSLTQNLTLAGLLAVSALLIASFYTQGFTPELFGAVGTISRVIILLFCVLAVYQILRNKVLNNFAIGVTIVFSGVALLLTVLAGVGLVLDAMGTRCATLLGGPLTCVDSFVMFPLLVFLSPLILLLFALIAGVAIFSLFLKPGNKRNYKS